MKERILAKLQELREDDLAAMEFAAGRSVALIQAYCGIEKVPEELLQVGISLAGWLLDSGMTGGGGNAKSIREGDVSVTFAEGTFGADAKEQAMLEYYAVELNRWRRMDW